MSFNISTRLNNLQYQINQKTANPLTSDLNCAGFDIDNCGTLHYTTLDPPVGGSAQNLDETLTAGNSAGNMSIVDLSAVVLSDVDGVNEDIIISQIPELGGRINVYRPSDVISPTFNSSATVALGNLLATNNITAGGNLNVGVTAFPSTFTLDGSFVLVNDGPPSGQCILSCNTSNELVISNGLRTTGNITCGTLNYTSLNPPVGGGSVGTLSQVLTTGNDATGLNMTNIGNLFSASIQGVGATGKFQIGNSASNFYANNDGAGNRTLVLGDCITNFNNSGLVLNLNDPVFSSSPATKNYVDNSITTYNSTAQYINTGVPGPDAINALIPNTGAITTLFTTPQITKPAGVIHRVMITFHNKNILSGSNFYNVLTGLIQISNLGGIFTPSTIEPYGSGFLFGPDFLGWFEIPASWTQYSYRIQASQTNSLIPNYNLAADLMVTTFKI